MVAQWEALESMADEAGALEEPAAVASQDATAGVDTIEGDSTTAVEVIEADALEECTRKRSQQRGGRTQR